MNRTLEADGAGAVPELVRWIRSCASARWMGGSLWLGSSQTLLPGSPINLEDSPLGDIPKGMASQANQRKLLRSL